MSRLIQLLHRASATRRVALIEEPHVRLLDVFESVYALANTAIASRTPVSLLVTRHATGDRLDYDPIYNGTSEWKLLPPIDHPEEPARCLVSGTGLTHVGSARDRHAMHEKQAAGPAGAGEAPPAASPAPPVAAPAAAPVAVPAAAQTEALTDSMRMFQAGLDGGRPPAGEIGVAPEWFYKGTGVTLRAHGDPLTMPAFAEDAGEEAELAGLYVIDAAGVPHRVGMAMGNEFSDHRFERRNYLNLAGSKLRECAIGPELVLSPDFHHVPGEAWIERGSAIVWRKSIASGDANMSHSLLNLEHHHFKFPLHRRPGDVHVHFFGAHSLSFGEGVALSRGDVMAIRFEGYGRTLRNTLRVEETGDRLVIVTPLL